MKIKASVAGVLVALLAFSSSGQVTNGRTVTIQAQGRLGRLNEVETAAADGDVAKLKEQFTADPKGTQDQILSLIRLAAWHVHPETVEFLCSQGIKSDDKGFQELNLLTSLAMSPGIPDDKCAEMAAILIAHGAPVDPVDTMYKETPLMRAVEFKKGKLAGVLLEHGADLTRRYGGVNSGMTLLHMAVRDNDKETVASLLKFKASADVVNRDDITPLSMAEGRGETEIAAMLREANPDAAKNIPSYSPAPTKEEMRALARRIVSGDDAAFDELADVNDKLYREIKDYHKEQDRVMFLSGRMLAVFDLLGEEAGKGNDKALQALKKCVGAKGRMQGFGVGALGTAAARGNKEALDILVHYQDWNILEFSAREAIATAASSNVEAAVEYSANWLQNLQQPGRDIGGVISVTNALASAAEKGNQKAKDALEKFVSAQPPPRKVSAGPPGLQPRIAGTPEHWAYLVGDKQLLDRVLASSELLESLDSNGETPLVWAVKAHKLDLAQLFLEHGAGIPGPQTFSGNPAILDSGLNQHFRTINQEKTPVPWAVMHGDKEMLALLIEFKAPIDAADQDGETPLHYAVKAGNNDIVEMLLDANVQLTAVDGNGATPLFLAEAADNEEIAGMIREAATARGITVSGITAPSREMMQAIATRIVHGDAAAFDELTNAAAQMYLGIDYQRDRARKQLNAERMLAAFDIIRDETIKGNDKAFQALKKCLGRKDAVSSFAASALGKAAAAGNEEALNMLLDYNKWGIPAMSAYSALGAAARANNERAIDAFAALLSDPSNARKQTFYGAAASGKDILKTAAARGNKKAEDALEKFEAEQPELNSHLR